jgi:hypothetical protein
MAIARKPSMSGRNAARAADGACAFRSTELFSIQSPNRKT